MRRIRGKQITALILAGILTVGNPGFYPAAVQAAAFEKSGAGEISSAGSAIGEMFEIADENTWLFAGGVEAEGRYAEIQGNRSYVGHFEECVRRGGDGSGLQHHRYTISVGKAGQDLSGFLEKLDGERGYLAELDPRAVVYLIGEEDYDQGASGAEKFKENMISLISRALELKENRGFAVIQLPHAVRDAADMANISLYAEAAEEAVRSFSEEQRKRVVLVDLYTGTNTETFLEGGNLTGEGRLNAEGHYEIARLLCAATVRDLSNFPVRTFWEEEEMPQVYQKERPETLAGTESLNVKMPPEAAQEEWSWELDINGMTIQGEASGDAFTIGELPANKSYKLTVRSKDKSVQFASVYGKVAEGYRGGEQELNALWQKLAEKVHGDEPLIWLFTGDSITHGLVHTKGYDSVPQIFEKYVREDLGRQDDIVINTGVSSTDSTWLLENIGTRVTKYHPDVVSVMIGTNDVYTNVSDFHRDEEGQPVRITPEVYRENLKGIVQRIREANPDAVVIFRSATPTRQGGRDAYLTNGYLQTMEEVAKEDGGILYIDQYHDWDREVRTFSYLWGAGYYFNDTNLHPGAAGQLKMMQQFVRETGLDTDTRLANLSYKFAYVKSTSEAVPEVICGGDKVKIARDALQKAYVSAGGTGTVGALEIRLTDGEGRTYTQSTGTEGADFVMKGIPEGTYTVDVTGTLAERAEKVSFRTQTIVMRADQMPEYEILLDSCTVGNTEPGEKAGVFSMDEMAPEVLWTYTLCEGEGDRDNGLFEVKGRTLKIREALENRQEYHIRIRAEGGGFQKERALVIRTVQTLPAVRKEAQEALASGQTALDVDVHDFTFDGTGYIDLADPTGGYDADGAYLAALNHLKDDSSGGTVIFRFRTTQKGGLIFGAGSTAAADGKNMIFGLDSNGMLRGYFRIASGNGLLGSLGTNLADGKWHTVAMSFDMGKADFMDQALISVDGGENIYPASWWTENFRTWFSASREEIVNFAIGGGAYAGAANLNAFQGEIDFVTITGNACAEDELRMLSAEAAQEKEPEKIAGIKELTIRGDRILLPDGAGCEASDIVWSEGRSRGSFYLTAADGYQFEETLTLGTAKDGTVSYRTEATWETEQEVRVTLIRTEQEVKPPAEDEKPDVGKTDEDKITVPPGGTSQSPGKPAATKKVTAKQIKKKAQVKITWKKVRGAKAYVIYRSQKKKKGFVKIKLLKGEKKISFVDRKVKKGKTYYYRVVVKTGAGYSAPKVSKAVKIKR